MKPAGDRPGVTQGGGTAAKAILTPWRLGRGCGESSVFWRGGGCLYLFIFWKREARASWFSSHSRERRRVRERGRPPGFGSGAGGSRWLRIPEFPPQLRRPGNVRLVSGAGAGPGGRKEHPSLPRAPHPSPGLWLLSAREWSPSPPFFWRVLVGRVWEREV